MQNNKVYSPVEFAASQNALYASEKLQPFAKLLDAAAGRSAAVVAAAVDRSAADVAELPEVLQKLEPC